MTGPSNLGSLLVEGAPVVRLFHAALRRDPTTAELDQAREQAREAGSLLPVAAALATGPEYRRLHGHPGNARTLVEQMATEHGALLPGLLPGLPPDEPTAYALWVKLYDQPTQALLDALPRLDGPPITIAMAAGDTEIEAVVQTVGSLSRQVHPHWTLHLATCLMSPWPREAVAPAIRDVRVVHDPAPRDDPLRAAVDAAIAQAGDGWIAVLQPGDLLAPTALHETAAIVASRPDLVMLRTDEDIVDDNGRRSMPRFKPAWSPFGDEAIGQLAIYRSALLAEAVAARDPSVHSWHAIATQAARSAGKQLFHHPAVLCHRRSSRAEPARSMPALPARSPSLTATVIVPTRNHAALVATCAEGVLRRTSFPSLQLLIVDNGSDEPDTLTLLDTLAADRRVQVLRAPGSFNFARLNNLAAAEATGELLILLNNDVEIRDGGWLLELERLASRPEVGVVGARLLYADGTIQHAGLLLGPEGAATHVGRHFPADEPGYLGRFERVNELSAVTGACLAIRREVWHRVGGMDERLAVTFNDVDLCLRVRAAGLHVLWTPRATLVHHEARTRGLEGDDSRKLERFERERSLMRGIWGEAVDADPFLNANLLAMESGHLVATRPRRCHDRPIVSEPGTFAR